MVYKVPKSHHFKQRELDEKPLFKRLFLGVFALFSGVAFLVSWILVFPHMLTPFWGLIAREPLVNIHFQGYFLGGNFVGIVVIMAGVALTYYRRPLLPEEMKPFWRWVMYISGIGGFICMVGLGIILVVSSYILIGLNGYSRCAVASNASQWNSYWALDQRECPMPSQG